VASRPEVCVAKRENLASVSVIVHYVNIGGRCGEESELYYKWDQAKL
jgi:hypothetical protein